MFHTLFTYNSISFSSCKPAPVTYPSHAFPSFVSPHVCILLLLRTQLDFFLLLRDPFFTNDTISSSLFAQTCHQVNPSSRTSARTPSSPLFTTWFLASLRRHSAATSKQLFFPLFCVDLFRLSFITVRFRLLLQRSKLCFFFSFLHQLVTFFPSPYCSAISFRYVSVFLSLLPECLLHVYFFSFYVPPHPFQFTCFGHLFLSRSSLLPDPSSPLRLPREIPFREQSHAPTWVFLHGFDMSTSRIFSSHPIIPFTTLQDSHAITPSPPKKN